MTRLDPTGTRPTLGRRPLLLGSGAVALVAVTGCSWLDRDSDEPEPAVHPDHGLLSAARDDQQLLRSLLFATQETHPGLGRVVGPAIDRATARLAVLDHALDAEETPTASGTSSAASGDTDPTQPAPPAPPAVPAGRPAARKQLVRASRETGERRAKACAEATDPGVARLLASLAAGYAQDVVSLQRGGSA